MAFCEAIRRLLVSAGTNDFDLNAAVFSLAFFGLVVSNWLLLAFAFGVNTVLFHTFAGQVGLDSFSGLQTELLVVSVRCVAVGVTHSNDDFQVDVFDLANQVVQLGFAFWLDDGFVSVKESVSSVSYFGGCWWLRSWSWAWGCWLGSCSWGSGAGQEREELQESSGWSWCWSNDSAIATSSSSSWGPVGIAPAQGAVSRFSTANCRGHCASCRKLYDEPAAKAVPANATDANNIATLFNLFIFILKIDTTARAVPRRVACNTQINSWTDCATVTAHNQICSYKQALKALDCCFVTTI